jgi:hypothetical protein
MDDTLAALISARHKADGGEELAVPGRWVPRCYQVSVVTLVTRQVGTLTSLLLTVHVSLTHCRR